MRVLKELDKACFMERLEQEERGQHRLEVAAIDTRQRIFDCNLVNVKEQKEGGIQVPIAASTTELISRASR